MSKEQDWVNFKFPFPVRAINGLLNAKSKFTDSADDLINRAKRKTGLSDFGDEFFMPALRRYISELNDFGDFHAFGAIVTKNKIIQQLENRLWAQHWMTNHRKEIDRQLPPILMITGLQRSGTTFMQRLLGSLDEFKGLDSGDVVYPVPTSLSGSYPSRAGASFALKALEYFNQTLQAIHYIAPDELEEEVVLMDHSFMTTLEETLLNESDIGLWLEQQDNLPVYKDLRMWLQLIQWKRQQKEMLLLKSPHHLLYLDHFHEVFPSAKIIHLHRTPLQAVPSFCSMVFHGKRTFLKGTDRAWIGRHWLRKDTLFVDNAMKARADIEKSCLLDISYNQFRNDPLRTTQRIYEFCNLDWSDRVVTQVNKYCSEYKQHKYGKHSYAAADYHLSISQIQEAFETYLDRFDGYLK